MEHEILDCIDAGTEFCPCHLAEANECILCSQLSGKTFCDCINWKGVCIYQEYVWNGNKAKNERKNYLCDITEKKWIENDLLLLTISIPHKLVKDLVHPGSYIFIRPQGYLNYYDAPISIMDSNTEENWIKVVIEIKGIKSKGINNLEKNDKVLVRGPFWNGILGLKNIYKCKEKTALLIARGIGQAPLVPVLKKLYSNGNNVLAVIDKGNCNDTFINEYLDSFNCETVFMNTFDKGELTDEFRDFLTNTLEIENVGLVYCAGQDILIYKVWGYLNDNINFASCNNAKMCCGEGICGSCTARFKGGIVKRFCKVQTEPKNIFEGRRLI